MAVVATSSSPARGSSSRFPWGRYTCFGHAEPTIEQIAAVVDVSPRTFFRSFPTKESVLTTDLLDEAVAQELEAAPADISIIDANHAAVTAAFNSLTDDE